MMLHRQAELSDDRSYNIDDAEHFRVKAMLDKDTDNVLKAVKDLWADMLANYQHLYPFGDSDLRQARDLIEQMLDLSAKRRDA